jgi:hypothetical protein
MTGDPIRARLSAKRHRRAAAPSEPRAPRPLVTQGPRSEPPSRPGMTPDEWLRKTIALGGTGGGGRRMVLP